MARFLVTKKRTWRTHKRGKPTECLALTDSIKSIFVERNLKELKAILSSGYISTDEMLYNAEDWLLSDVKVPRGWVSPLYLSIYHDWPDGFHYLLKKGADLERPVSHPPLALACRYRSVAALHQVKRHSLQFGKCKHDCVNRERVSTEIQGRRAHQQNIGSQSNQVD